MKTIVGITGTTSVGKSAVAVKLAKLLKSEIVSADSMQIYKDMDIGTAKITLAEMDGVPHHMLSVVTPNCNYSSFLYQQDASKIIDKINGVPIVVGGTGFYFDSLLYPPEFGNCKPGRREELLAILDEQGIEVLQQELLRLDVDTYNSIDINNPKRVVRAIEIAESGVKKSQGKGRIDPKYNLLLFVLQRNRTDLYSQIDLRVDQMISNGLIDEVRKLIDKYGVCDTPAFSAIGYKEVIEYLQELCGLQECIDKIKLNTRHYAKRQITYYKKMNVTQFVDVDGRSSDDIAQYIYDFLITQCGIIR